MTGMRRIIVYGALLTILAMAAAAFGQKDQDEATSWLHFLVVKDDNGKPVRNAAVIMHSVNDRGKQERGGLELKTDSAGKADFDGVPYGKLRVQVLAQGFQTYGEDFYIDKPKMDFTIKLKRPQTQFSVYDDHPKDSGTPPKGDAPPPDQKDQKPN
jgi:hypothetical protein